MKFNRSTSKDNLSRLLMKYRKQKLGLLIIIIIYALLGSLLAPVILKDIIVERIKNQYQSSLSITAIEINPFELSLKVIDFELKDKNDSVIIQADELFINFQLSSIYHQEWTFDELRISSPELFIKRNASSQLNINYFFETSTPLETKSTLKEDSNELLPLLFSTVLIDNGVINWEDNLPIIPLKTRFGPINANFVNFHTLSDHSAHQSVQITTESQGTIDWKGSLQLNPFKSVAHASIKGSHFPLISSYISHQLGLEITEGSAEIELDYSIQTDNNDAISIDINNLNVGFYDLLVKTFSSLNSAPGSHDLIRLPILKLTGGSINWPSQIASIDTITIDNSIINFYRGSSDFSQFIQYSETINEKENDDKDWDVKLGDLSINNLKLNVQDSTINPEENIGVSALSLQIKDIDNQPNSKFPTSLSLQVQSGGSIQSSGEVTLLPELLYELELNVSDLALEGAQPYIEQYIDLKVNTGILNIKGQLNKTLEETLLYNGDINIMNLLFTDVKTDIFLGSLERLWAEKVSLSIANNSIDIHQLHLDRPSGDIVVDENGDLKISQLLSSNSSTIDSQNPESAKEGSATKKDPEMSINVGNVLLANASINFTDQSLPLPFTTKVIDLNGSLSAISSLSELPSTANFEGQIDEYGYVRITGTVSPLSPNIHTDLLLSFSNIVAPKYSAYTIPFAGKEISSGSLDMQLKYKLKNNQLSGENKITLTNFELGKDVPHPDSVSLPLGLAVALLRDVNGKINIELSVKGDITSPDFSYGSIVGKALSNLLIKVVASPFTLLANLVALESNEFEHLNFIPGRSDLSPPEIEKVLKLAEALSLRPDLILKLAGVYNTEIDTTALKEAQLDLLLKSRVEALKSTTNTAEKFSTVQIKVLEQLFQGQLFQGQDTEAELNTKLATLRENFTTIIAATTELPSTTQFDEISYINELKVQLRLLQSLPETALIELATERAKNTERVLLNFNKELHSQILIASIVNVSKKADNIVIMKPKFSTKSLND